MNIIYKNQNGAVSVFTPTQEALDMLTLDEIAQRVVPAPYQRAVEWDENEHPTKFETVKTPYWIVDPSAIPSDRTFRGAWELDESQLGEPNGYGGVE